MADSSRHSILLAVREHGRALLEPQNPFVALPERWTPQQWWQAFQFLFVEDDTHDDKQQSKDDMLFFVLAHPPEPSKQQPNPVPFIVRRKTSPLPADLQLSGARFSEIAWDASVLLNIVLQASFQLTVVACKQEVVTQVTSGALSGPEVLQVTKTVFASPTFTAVNLDSTRADATEPVVTYPEICFAVDNFDDTFEDVVLSVADQCYCVLLSAAVDDDLTTSSRRCTTTSDQPTPASAPTSRQASKPLDACPSDAASSIPLGDNDSSSCRSRTTSSDSQVQHPGPSGESSGAAVGAPGAVGGEQEEAGASHGAQQKAGAGGLGGGAGGGGNLGAQVSWDRQGSEDLVVSGGSGALTQYADLAVDGQQEGAPAEKAGAASGQGPGIAGTSRRAIEPQESVRTVWGARKVEMFAGFVSQAQIANHISRQERGNPIAVIGGILAGTRTALKERIVMTGPGGLGRAEVAITLMPPSEAQLAADAAEQAPASSTSLPAGGPGSTGGQGVGGLGNLRGKLMHRVKHIAGQVTKAIAEERMAAAAMKEGAAVSLQCALITLRLPVHVVAEKLLSIL